MKCHFEQSEESSIHAAFRFFTSLRSVQNDINVFTIVDGSLVLVLVTNNIKHFKNIENLQIENWI